MWEIFCLKKIFGCITNSAKNFPPLQRRGGKPPPTLFSGEVADFQDVFNSTVLNLMSWGEVLALRKPTAMCLPAPTKPSRGRTRGNREGLISSSVLWSEVWVGGFLWSLHHARSLSSYSRSSPFLYVAE